MSLVSGGGGLSANAIALALLVRWTLKCPALASFTDPAKALAVSFTPPPPAGGLAASFATAMCGLVRETRSEAN